MAEIKMSFKGWKAVAALIVVAFLMGFRFFMMGNADDPKLDKEVRKELMLELGGQTQQQLASLDPMDAQGALDLAEKFNADKIEIHSLRTSKPLPGLSDSGDIIVQVDYTLPGGTRQKEFWLFKHSLIAGWRYQRPSTALSYYLNFF